jgi:hypothetical protein
VGRNFAVLDIFFMGYLSKLKVLPGSLTDSSACEHSHRDLFLTTKSVIIIQQLVITVITTKV